MRSRPLERIRPLGKDEVTPEIRQAMEQAERAYGELLITHGIMAHAPAIFDAARSLGAAPARNRALTHELRGLVCVRVAQLAGCPF